MLAVESGRVIGAVGTFAGHVITGARSAMTVTWYATTAIVLRAQQTSSLVNISLPPVLKTREDRRLSTGAL